MIDQLREIIVTNWGSLPMSQDVPVDSEQLSFTKFCQRIVQPHTKVLFLVTYKNRPLCILKTIRGSLFNEKLLHEKESQKKAPSLRNVSVPKIYFEGYVEDLYLYAEEVVQGTAVSQQKAKKHEEELVRYVSSFPTQGEIMATTVAQQFLDSGELKDKKLDDALAHLKASKAMLKIGFTHGDFARPNMINSLEKIYIVDWERSKDRPFWLLDAVYFLVKLRKVENLQEWEKKASSALQLYTGIDAETSEALYLILVVCEILYRKYPKEYKRLIGQFSTV